MDTPKCLICGEEMVPGGHGYMCFNGCDLEYRTIPPLGYCTSGAITSGLLGGQGHKKVEVTIGGTLCWTILPNPSAQPLKNYKGVKPGCFIATACYGSYNHPRVVLFRQFRDEKLVNVVLGRTFIQLYYRFSPPLADYLKRHAKISCVIRKCILNPISQLMKLKT